MDTLEFIFGIGVAFLSHEGGHEIAGRGDVDWRGTEWHCSAPCDGQRIAAAGYYSQIAVSEAVARVFEEAEHRDGDIDNFDEPARRRMRGVLLVFSAYSAVQLFKGK